MLTWSRACHCFSLHPTLRGHLLIYGCSNLRSYFWDESNGFCLHAARCHAIFFWLLSEPTGRNRFVCLPIFQISSREVLERIRRGSSMVTSMVDPREVATTAGVKMLAAGSHGVPLSRTGQQCEGSHWNSMLQGHWFHSEVTVKKKMANYWDLRDSWLLWGREGRPFSRFVGSQNGSKHARAKFMSCWSLCWTSHGAGRPMLAFSTERNSSATRTQVLLQWNYEWFVGGELWWGAS